MPSLVRTAAVLSLSCFVGVAAGEPASRPEPATQPAAATKPITGDRHSELQSASLVVAARRGEVDAVRRLIAAGNVPVDELETALAASFRDPLDAWRGLGRAPMVRYPDDGPDPTGLEVGRRLTEITRLLVEAGADPMSMRLGPTPLWFDSAGGSVDQVRAMLAKGVNVNAVFVVEHTPQLALTGAIRHGKIDTVQLLLDAGAIPRIPGTDGEIAHDGLRPMPLPVANAELLRLLVDRGADVRATIPVRLEDGTLVNPPGPGGMTLIQAAGHAEVESVALLLDRGVRDENVLLSAAEELFSKARTYESKDDIRARERGWLTDRNKARVQTLRLLLDAGLWESESVQNGALLVHAAAMDDRLSVQVFRERGVKVDPPQMLAQNLSRVDEKEKQRIAALPESERYSGYFDNALLSNDLDDIRTLAAEGLPLSIGAAAQVGDVARVRELVEKDPSLAKRYPSGNGGFGPLRNAALNGHLEVCKLLIDAGADVMPPVGSQGWGGMTPLEAAAIGGHPDVVKLLLERGARVYVKNLTDTDTTLIEHVEAFIRRAQKAEESRRAIGVLEVLPLLKAAAATQPTTRAATTPER